MLLSICIPTYNRLECLINCLNSILISNQQKNLDFEICISDNNSNGNVDEIINNFKKKLNINFNKNSENIGHGRNFFKAVSMARGEYVWTLGNDDLILPNTLTKIKTLLDYNRNVDFFFLNSYHLESKHVFSHPQPFDTKKLPNNMKKYSEKHSSYELKFLDLIDPKISADYLMGMYLLLFRKKIWDKNLNIIDQKKISDPKTFSTFENTCGYVKIISKGFSNSKAYFCGEPLSVNLKGEREWGDLYDFIEIIRIPEILDVHRSNGLPFIKYIYLKNYSLKNFLPNFVKMFLRREKSGFNYINFRTHFFKQLLYPNCYLSLVYFLFRKIKLFYEKFIKN